MNKKSIKGSLLLLLGSVIWGAAFVAQRVGMDHMGPFTFNGIRMLLAWLVMVPVSVFLESGHKKNPGYTAPDRKEQRIAGLLCGVLLFAASSLQQMGLVTTTAGKAGFITALYVVLVPVAGWLLLRKNPGRIIWMGVALAVVALWLLCMPAGGIELQSGDLLVLGCAVCFTFQILCVDHYAPRVSSVKLARDEFLVTGGLSMAVALLTEEITAAGIREALIPILYAGILSGAAGYTLQVIGQRDTDPTVASLLMCLEAVFAVLTGAVLLGEKMTAREAAGCILMFTAVILAQLSPVISSFRRNGRSHR
ncbi:MAG: DMT family transporter [Clostridia bacterium]|nr:DMT family transporter [Clostridia bacterium]